MHEALDLKPRLLLHLPDLRKGQLPCRNHPGDPFLLKKCRSVRTGDRHLRARMNRQIRKIPSQIPDHSQILNDHAVGAPQIIELVDLRILEQRIDRKIDSPPMDMNIIDRLQKLLFRQVLRICPCPESRPADIDRIRPRTDCRPKALYGACRCKYLNSSSHHTSPL